MATPNTRARRSDPQTSCDAAKDATSTNAQAEQSDAARRMLAACTRPQDGPHSGEGLASIVRRLPQ